MDYCILGLYRSRCINICTNHSRWEKEPIGYPKEDAKVSFVLQSRIDVLILPKIVGYNVSKDCWDTLECAYKGYIKVRITKIQMLQTLQQKMHLMPGGMSDPFVIFF